MSAAEFVGKWGKGGSAARLNERAGAQSHFIDLCRMLGLPLPGDPDTYCFERGLWGVQEGRKFADVWKRGCFAWEYKAPGGDLRAALAQLMQYALPLENPPLLIVSDRRTIQIHTHFTGHPSLMHELRHEDLRDSQRQTLLRAAFLSPNDFRPIQTTSALTAELAGKFARIADALRKRGETPFRAAHFLTQCVFCSFAEDVGVLPEHVFRRVVEKQQSPAALRRGLTELFRKMQTGGEFGADTIPWFNGGLFAVVDIPLLEATEIAVLLEAAAASWQSIDPSILGTLFERGLDPSKRNQLGAHFTDATTIERLVDPVVRRPLLQEWDCIKRSISGLMSQRDVLTVRARGVPSKTPALNARYGGIRSAASRAHKQARDLLSGFLQRLQDFRVLDPACGSGNFLFLSLKALKDIEHQVNFDAEELGLERQIPVTGPHNVLGVEINEYAAELARATVWIGELQWRKQHGYGWKINPILDPLDQIECRDALIGDDQCEAKWPAANVVVGNPPFVGVGRKRRELGDSYVEALDRLYAPRVPGASDLVCYWFDKAQRSIEAGQLQRAGLVGTNSIRGGANRMVLDRIASTGRIFDAWSDEPWINDGAAVRVSLVCFGDGHGTSLNGHETAAIYADLTTSSGSSGALDLTTAKPLLENTGASFQGASKKAKFEVDAALAREWLLQPNPHGRPNSDVLKPWANGFELSRGPQHQWIIDFGARMREEDAALYELPFAYVQKNVRPERLSNSREAYRKYWWRFAEPRPALRTALANLPRFISTVAHSKHRFFVWLPVTTSPDQALITIARSDDTTLGVLHSRFHEIWSLRLGTSLEDRPRYTPTTCFETFPFPPGLTPADTKHQRTEPVPRGALVPADLPAAVRVHAVAIAVAAARLMDLREAWLNPRGWTERVPDVVPLGMAVSPYPDRVVVRQGFEKEQAKRTLTNLYNEQPAWLTKAHETLDAAVAAAYGWTSYSSQTTDDEILQRLLTENLQRTQRQQGSQLELAVLGVVEGSADAADDRTRMLSTPDRTAPRRKPRQA